MIEENKNEVLKNENCVSKENGAIESICDRRCKICGSEHIQEIHLLKKNGRQLGEIVAMLLEKYNFVVSDASLSRHFTKYRERQQLVSAQIMNSEIVEDATKQSAHAKEIVKIIDLAIGQIKKKAELGQYTFDVSDLDKLMKLKYQVLAGENVNETDIMAIFQKATDKYGFNVNQGVLFKTRRNEAVA